MYDSSHATEEFVPTDIGNAGPSFLSTHRAVAVCAREFSRLSDEMLLAVRALYNSGGYDTPPVFRQSPERCIAQLGNVALTVAWIRHGMESIATGELLVIVWDGMVAPPNDFSPERARLYGKAAPVTALWEEALVPQASSEATWRWHIASSKPAANATAVLEFDAPPRDFSSAELAGHCVARLQQAHAARV